MKTLNPTETQELISILCMHKRSMELENIDATEWLQSLDTGLTDQELKYIVDYEPPVEYKRLMALMQSDVLKDTEVEMIEASINLALHFELINDYEYADLMIFFVDEFKMRTVNCDGMKMIAAAFPFWTGIENMTEDGFIYMHDGMWMNIFSGETKEI